MTNASGSQRESMRLFTIDKKRLVFQRPVKNNKHTLPDAVGLTAVFKVHSAHAVSPVSYSELSQDL